MEKSAVRAVTTTTTTLHLGLQDIQTLRLGLKDTQILRLGLEDIQTLLSGIIMPEETNNTEFRDHGPYRPENQILQTIVFPVNVFVPPSTF